MSFGQNLRTMWVIFKREFSLYFISPIFYIVGAAFLFMTGFFFVGYIVSIMAQGFGEPNMTSTLGTLGVVMLFVAPFLTMRLLAEELNRGTLELLLTRPVLDWHVVVGKFLAAWGVFTTLLLISAIFPIILMLGGNPDRLLILSGYLGAWLLGGMMLSIGVLMSSLTKYQLIAAVLSFVALLTLYLATFLTSVVQLVARGTVGTFRTVATDVLDNIASQRHYSAFLRGTPNATDIAYFVFLMILALFLATRVLESRRWRS